MKVGYIPGTARLPRSRTTSTWEYRRIPAIYIPAHVKATEDQSKYYMKTPQEMSRYEIAELEREFKELDEPEEFVDEKEMLESEEFRDLQEQMKQIQPIRHAMIKRFFMKYKWQRKKREEILAMAEDAEEFTKEVLRK